MKLLLIDLTTNTDISRRLESFISYLKPDRPVDLLLPIANTRTMENLEPLLENSIGHITAFGTERDSAMTMLIKAIPSCDTAVFVVDNTVPCLLFSTLITAVKSFNKDFDII